PRVRSCCPQCCAADSASRTEALPAPSRGGAGRTRDQPRGTSPARVVADHGDAAARVPSYWPQDRYLRAFLLPAMPLSAFPLVGHEATARTRLGWPQPAGRRWV
ncbi:hypothetical protein Dimus_018332, partial [Dionaea muscipula]